MRTRYEKPQIISETSLIRDLVYADAETQGNPECTTKVTKIETEKTPPAV